MAAAAEVQDLLRFLAKDAKVPLAVAMPQINNLRKAGLSSAEAISGSNIDRVKQIFPDEKLAKQVLAAAKRVSNPRKRSSTSNVSSSPAKRLRGAYPGGEISDTARIEAQLTLPTTQMPEEELLHTTIQTNRAPLVLAFAVTLLKFTMPEQPLSSRLSLAQAVVSANSQTKARSIGLESGASAEEEGWGKGQPKVRVMSREIPVMRRSGYTVTEEATENECQRDVQKQSQRDPEHNAFWGLDLEALRKSNGPVIAGKKVNGHTDLPIYTAQSARSYLLKSFAIVEIETLPKIKSEDSPSKNKPSVLQNAARKEEAAAVLLKTLNLLCESWASTLGNDELDRRAWSWYLQVRPDVAQGQAGWGQKGQIKLEEILKLRRTV